MEMNWHFYRHLQEDDMLNKLEKERYSRQMMLPEIGEEGQSRLKRSHVLIIGVGGLASTAAQYLVSAGVGQITLVDGDVVESSNLARQVLYTTKDLGKKKVEVAQKRLQSLNEDCLLQVHDVYFSSENAAELLREVDVVLDCTDNYSTRYVLSDLSAEKGIPLVYAALHKYEGQLAVFNYKGGPSYRHLFPDEGKAQNIPTCVEAGVFSTLPALMGLQQANEALKILLDLGDVISGKLLTINVLNNETYITELELT